MQSILFKIQIRLKISEDQFDITWKNLKTIEVWGLIESGDLKLILLIELFELLISYR